MTAISQGRKPSPREAATLPQTEYNTAGAMTDICIVGVLQGSGQGKERNGGEVKERPKTGGPTGSGRTRRRRRSNSRIFPAEGDAAPNSANLPGHTPLPDSPSPDSGSREVLKGRLPPIPKGLPALGLERRRVPVGQGMRGGHAGEVVGERGMVWASAMRSRVLGSHAPRRSEGGRGRGTGCRVSVGLPEAARFAAPGRRLLTQALPPASLPAPSQTQARIPISTPTSANGGCTPKAGTCLRNSALSLSASGWKCPADSSSSPKVALQPPPIATKPRT